MSESTVVTAVEDVMIEGSLVRHRGIEPSRVRLINEGEVLPDEAGLAIHLRDWPTREAEIRGRTHPVGIVVSPDDDLSVLTAEPGTPIEPDGIAYFAIEFPAYTDGRGFSLAQRLRRQYGWKGELRAIGDVLIDTVYYLARSGFDAFLLNKPGHDPKEALAALHTFTANYQQSYPNPN